MERGLVCPSLVALGHGMTVCQSQVVIGHGMEVCQYKVADNSHSQGPCGRELQLSLVDRGCDHNRVEDFTDSSRLSPKGYMESDSTC